MSEPTSPIVPPEARALFSQAEAIVRGTDIHDPDLAERMAEVQKLIQRAGDLMPEGVTK